MSNEIITPQASVATSSTVLTKVAVHAYLRPSSATGHGNMWAYASQANLQASLVQQGYVDQGPAFTVFDATKVAPPTTQLLMMFGTGTTPVAYALFLLPTNLTKQQYINQLLAENWIYYGDVGYAYSATSSVPTQDSQPLIYLTANGNALWNNYYTDNAAIAGVLGQSGWTNHGAIAKVMPIYSISCSVPQGGNTIALSVWPQNDPADPESFYVGPGMGNLISFTSKAANLRLSNVSFSPSDPSTLDILSKTSTLIQVADNNSNVSPGDVSYSFTVYGIDAYGNRVQSDPKIINRTGSN